MAKPRLGKVRALFYVFQHVIKRGCAYFDTAPFSPLYAIARRATLYIYPHGEERNDLDLRGMPSPSDCARRVQL